MPTDGVTPWCYPAAWASRLVKGKGMISLHGQGRYVGEAFEGERVGLRRHDEQTWRVYFGPHLVGELAVGQPQGIRARWHHRRQPGRQRQPGVKPKA